MTELMDIELMNDGGYLIVGGTNSFGSGRGMFILYKTNSRGIGMAKTFGGTGEDEILYCKRNLYYIGGITTSMGGGNDMYLIKGRF